MPRRLLLSFVALALLAACSKSTPASAPSGTRPATTDAPTTTTSGAPANSVPTAASIADARVRLTEIVSGLDRPVALAPRHGTDTLYVAEQSGAVRAIVGGHLTAARVLDLRGKVSTGGEQGLLGIAFSPDGTHLYIDFTDPAGDTHVQEFRMNGDVAVVSSRRELLFQKQPYSNHNGGEVVFGPDGLLYIGLGDGGSAGDPQNHAQDTGSLLGKILRIDPQPHGRGAYTVPADNPFVADAKARPEVWQYGLRNPWRFSFDRATGDLWIGDVGQNQYEEVDFAKAGRGGVNFGWSQREATHRFKGERPAGAVDPVYEYSHADGGVAITGGYVYRGSRLPALVGAYIFSDYSEGIITALAPSPDGGRVAGESILNRDIKTGISSFGQDNAGELYVLDLGGKVFRIDPA